MDQDDANRFARLGELEEDTAAGDDLDIRRWDMVTQDATKAGDVDVLVIGISPEQFASLPEYRRDAFDRDALYETRHVRQPVSRMPEGVTIERHSVEGHRGSDGEIGEAEVRIPVVEERDRVGVDDPPVRRGREGRGNAIGPSSTRDSESRLRPPGKSGRNVTVRGVGGETDESAAR